jgi:hypothetical protein
MVLTFFEMEKTLYSDFDNRLKLDDALLRMRQEFEVRKETLRRKLIQRFNLKPPPSPLIVNPGAAAFDTVGNREKPRMHRRAGKGSSLRRWERSDQKTQAGTSTLSRDQA